MKRIFAGSAMCLVLVFLSFVLAQESDEKPRPFPEYTAESLRVTNMDVLRRLEAMYLSGTNPQRLSEYRLAWEILLEMESGNVSLEIDKRTPFQSVAAVEHYILGGYDAAIKMGNRQTADMETIRLVRDILKKQEARRAK